MRAFSKTARELCEKPFEERPKQFISNAHLIYSSPATLAFNSPGAEGFGVKRAGLSVPGSVMLLVSPGCCGRNTTMQGRMSGYGDRIYYLLLDDTDIVTGRHLKKIPAAVKEICEAEKVRPSAVMICITCVDALLGTDMERVCRRAQEEAGVPVRPCYMYALTREGRLPPMVAVRQSIYSMLEPRKRRADAVNILGFFSPLRDTCELYRYLRDAGVRTVREISRCRDFSEYLAMAEANFNLVLHTETRRAASDLETRLGIPYIELTRVYEIEKIRRQYRALGEALGTRFDDDKDYDAAQAALAELREIRPDLAFSVGEISNAEPVELSLALLRAGFRVPEIFCTLNPVNFRLLAKVAELSPETRVYSNLDPSMLFYDPSESGAEVAVGKDAVYYHPEIPGLTFCEEIQPFGYDGAAALYRGTAAALRKGVRVG